MKWQSSRFSVQQRENYVCEVLTLWLAHRPYNNNNNNNNNRISIPPSVVTSEAVTAMRRTKTDSTTNFSEWSTTEYRRRESMMGRYPEHRQKLRCCKQFVVVSVANRSA